MAEDQRALVAAITKKLVDQGKIIEAGWVSLRLMVVPKGAPQIQVDEMRNAFFAGAQHLFGSIMSVLDPGSEPTEDDLRRMSAIQTELDEFLVGFKKRHGLPHEKAGEA